MAKYSYHQVDANAGTLYAFLEAHGATVKRIGRPLDALVCYGGVTVLAEVKTLRGKIRPGQQKFLREWPGVARILRTEQDCLELLEEIRARPI